VWAKDGSSSRRRRPPGPRPGATALLAALLLVGAAPAHAQRYGQWSWSGAVGIGQRSYENDAGEGTLQYDEKELRLSLGLNGFVLNPAIAGFRLGADALFLRIDDAGTRSSVRWGGRGDISILPRSAVPVRLYAGHDRYEFGLGSATPVYSSATPDFGTTAGGRIRVRRGPLTGLLAGYDWHRLSFLEPGAGPQDRGVGFVDWTAPVTRLQPHLRIERRDEEYGSLGYAFRDWVGGYDHRGPVLGAWTWQLSASGLDRRTSYDQAPSLTNRSARVQSSFLRQTGSRGTLSIDYGLGYGEVSGGEPSVTQVGTVRLVTVFDRGLTAGSSVSWTTARYGAFSSDGPQASLNAGWAGRTGPWNASASLGASYLWQNQVRDGSEDRSSAWGGTVGLTLAHQGPAGLREEISISAGRNELRPAGFLDPDEPDVGWGIPVASTEDRGTARLTVSGPLGSLRASFWAEAERREASGDFVNPVGYRLDRETISATANGGRLGLAISAGRARVKNGTDEELRFVGASLSVRPTPWLSLGGSFRLDRRRLTVSPETEAWRGEALAGLSFGAFRLTGTGFLAEESVPHGSRRRNQGFTWALSRGFEGWLPFVSAPARRGVVR
jgi:hypothetical protein